MKIKKLMAAGFASNCYMVVSGNECAVVDPSASTAVIMNAAKNEGAEIKYILLTHAHFDHMLSLEELREETGAPLLLHRLEEPALKDPTVSLYAMMDMDDTFDDGDRILEDGDVLPLGDGEIKVIHTPGHTVGSVCYDCEGELITGDTLFAGTVGRCDFPGGDGEVLVSSVLRLYKLFSDDTVIYPGHEGKSTIGKEKDSNPYTLEYRNMI